MAMDVSQMMVGRENTRNGTSPDAAIMRKSVIICGAAIALLVAIKLGFMSRVLP